MAALTIAALLTEYGITPAENYAGEVTGDDYILAVDCSEAGRVHHRGGLCAGGAPH